jgi:hypothetical protein
MKASLWRAFGATVGVGAGIGGGIGLRTALSSGVGWALAGIGVAIAVWVLLYLIAQSYTTADRASSQYMLGLLLGVNTGVNAVLLQALFGAAVAVVICVIPLLAVIVPLARWAPYRFVLGWVNLLLPTSWPIVGLGAALFVLSLVFGWIPWSFVKIVRLRGSWTGTWFVCGGLGGSFSKIIPGFGGFSLGNFSFLPSGASQGKHVIHHEGGHTLNMAIWGSVVHLIGAIDEAARSDGQNAYTERFAEGNVPQDLREGWRTVFPMWGPATSTGTPPPAPAPPPPTAATPPPSPPPPAPAPTGP